MKTEQVKTSKMNATMIISKLILPNYQKVCDCHLIILDLNQVLDR